MRLAWLVLACACNQTFGLEATVLVDAPGPDAPPRCTVDEPPPFSTRFIQAVFQHCTHYTFQGNHAVALCRDTFYEAPHVAEGMLDGPLERTPITSGGRVFVAARLTPEGELYLQIQDRATPEFKSIVSVYRRAGEWMWSHDLPFILQAPDMIGMPSSGPRPHVLILRSIVSLDEHADDGTNTWPHLRTYAAANLGIEAFQGPANLSSDGLRMVVPADDAVYYASRPSIDVAFTRAARMELPRVPHAFLAEDCSRIYFDGLTSIFYATHR